jgi:hypothetical protein
MGLATTKSCETIAHLLPVTRKKTARAKMPDVAAGLKKVFRRKVISDKAMKQILRANRGDY